MGNNGCYNNKQYKQKQRDKKLGSLNPAYKTGLSRGKYRRIYVPIRNTLIQKCIRCGETKKLVCHHIDNDYTNNNLDNLTIVCKGCHNIMHKKRVIS